MIKPLQGSQPSFGMKYTHHDMNKVMCGTQVISRKTMDIIELDNKKVVVIGTRYEGNRVTDKIMTLWDESNNLLKTVTKSWFGGKKPSVLVINEPTLDKIV